jgi:tRNA pseudouridine38-40 synthase
MPRYKLILEYDGTPFVGWQRQENGISVQSVLEDAVFGFCGERVTTVAAGRTDSGVHAEGQVAHLDLMRETRLDTLRDALNAHLRPHPVVVLVAETVSEDFHARFSASARHYRYVILNRRAPPTLSRTQVWPVVQPLDAAAMNAAAKHLVGKHDFTTFRAAECQAKSPVKTLDRLDVIRDGDRIEIFASARSFLHHQVRSMVGSLKLVGLGRWSAGDFKAALEACDRAACGPVAPPTGLALLRVDYDSPSKNASA